MPLVVAPVDHKYPVAPLAVKTTLPPEQIVVEPLDAIVTVGAGLTVIVTLPPLLVAVQPEVVPVTL
jgi:hypothetical protein